MVRYSEADKTGVVEVSGFGDLNVLNFIDAELPADVWPARIRIHGIDKSGHVAAKLHYIDIDGTDSEAVRETLVRGDEIPLTEIDCEIDMVRLLSEAGKLDVILPNTARLTKSHVMAIRE